jgi:hypothetical protein
MTTFHNHTHRPGADEDGCCTTCGLEFEDPRELAHECPPGFTTPPANCPECGFGFAEAHCVLPDNGENLHAWCLVKRLREQVSSARREALEDAEKQCWQGGAPLCAAPIHCGCREKVAAAIRNLMEAK